MADPSELFGADAVAAYAAVLARERGNESSSSLALAKTKALSRLGALRAAAFALCGVGPLRRRSPSDRREALGLRAGLRKAAAARSPAGPTRDRHERAALADYERAFAADGSPWPLVNLATLHRLRGDDGRARAAALRTLEVLATWPDDGWSEATRAEALLVLGRLDEAAAAYRAAPFRAARRFADAGSARRQARRLLAATGAPPGEVAAWLRDALPSPIVAVASGHMVDRPGRVSPRFPSGAEAAVADAIGAWVRARGVELGIASAACGTDLLFHGAVRAQGGRSWVMLPYPAREFAATSVDPAGAAWRTRFDELVERDPAWVGVISSQPLGANSTWYEYGNEVLEGIALLRAEALEAEVRRLVVWDGRDGDGPGGTAATVRRWRARGEAFDVIDPRHPERGAVAAPVVAGGRAGEARAPDVVGLLVADAKGYSRLDDDGLARFASEVLPRVAGVFVERGLEPRLVKTWGDGILAAYDDLESLARAAFALRDRVARERWGRFGLPEELTLRIALHAGPVRWIRNPVTDSDDVLGSHVSHASRLEPVTPPGEIFATEGFAALQRLRCPEVARCTWAGRAPWAKGYGEDLGGWTMYRVERG